jgi:hypothetical protein
MPMLELFRSVSFGTGTLMIVCISSIVAFVLANIPNSVLKWGLSVAVPYTLSYCLYWAPVWLGAEPYEYSAWELVFVIPWSLFGFIASAVVIKRKALKAWKKGTG